MATEVLKVEPEVECCVVCGVSGDELFSPEEHDAAMPSAQISLRAMLLHLNNNKVVPNGRLCVQCIRRTLDAYSLSVSLASKGPPPLSEKIQALRKRLHELTQKIDVFIVVGGGADGGYNEEDIIMVERDALAAASECSQPPRAALARGELGYQCTVCPETFQRLSLLREHLSSHSNVTSHNCWTCGAQFLSSSAAMAHAVTHQLRDNKCHACDTAFQSSLELRRHESSCTVCPECGAQMASRVALVSHMASHANRCSTCLAAVSPSQRAEHRLAHARDMRYVCGYDACILRFATRNDLLAHIRKCHNEDPVEEPETNPTTTCTVCSRVFASVAALKRHSRVHREEKQAPVTQNMELGDEDGEGRIEYLEVETLEELENDADL